MEMNIRRISNIVLAVLVIAASAACKKEEESTKKFLSGGMSFEVDAYVRPGTTVKMTPSGVTHPEDLPIGYSWSFGKLGVKTDTTKLATADDTRDGSISFTFPDTLGTFTITASAFAPDYYSSTGSRIVTVVKPGLEGGSLSGIEFIEGEDETLDDVRSTQPESISYAVRNVGGRLWMRQNLAYTEKDRKIGLAYQDCEAMSEILGRYYSWEDAKTACPSGYHLPSEAELIALIQPKASSTLTADKAWEGCSGKMMSYVKFNGSSMWEYWPDVKVTDDFGLSFLPAGYCNLEDKKFKGIMEIAAFWTSDEYDSENGVYRYIVDDQPDVLRGAGNKKSFGASVRCVED